MRPGSLLPFVLNLVIGGCIAGESLVAGAWPAGAASPTPNKIGEIFIKYAP